VNTILAVIALAAVVLGLITAILGFLNQSRATRAIELAEETASNVQNISVQVDGRLTTLIERQAQLLGALHESGTPVPPAPDQAP
jgi:VIT1/CCC1 family predicted Fe2+/Mn2+ transporter